MEDESNAVVIYTDGSSQRTRKNVRVPGGWAFYAKTGGKTVTRYGHHSTTTVNEMELTGILRGLQFVRFTSQPIIIYTDSQYCRNVLETWVHGWSLQVGTWRTAQGFEVANQPLIRQVMRARFLHEQLRQVQIRWIKGHGKDLDNEHVFGNNVADIWAGKARNDRLSNWRNPGHIPEE